MRFIFNLLIVLFVSFSLILLTSPASAILPGDANGDGLVDGPDYVIWLNHYNQSATGAANGDFDNSGKVDGLDYVLWLNSYGKIEPKTSCLSRPGPMVTVSGNQTVRYDTRGNPLAADTKIDARTAVWTANWPVQDSFNYPILLAGGPNLCFSGGLIQGSYPDQISTDPNTTWEYMHGTTAIKSNGKNAAIENTRIDNYGDAIDLSVNSENFIIKSVYLSTIRDDCVQNDWLYSGLIEDSLFDGCYSAFSARTYSGQSPPADGTDNIWTIKNSLIRLQATWGVYKNRGLIPGHDGFFKWDSLGISPRLALHDNIFRVDQEANNVGLELPQGKLANCSNNTLVWLGSGPFPATLPEIFNGQPCFTITNDKSVWDKAVSDWKSRHGY